MESLNALVESLWAASFVLQVVILGLLIFRGHFRSLPFFTSYIALNLCQAVLLYAVYKRYGTQSDIVRAFAWQSEAITLIAKAFATVEVLRLALAAYRGIWGLAWRLVTFTCMVSLLGVLIAARGQGDWATMEADRGYHLIFATAVLACLVLIHYYRIQVASTYQILLAGFCFYSCMKILANTALQEFLYQRFPNSGQIWQSMSLTVYVLVLGVWTVALLRPLPARVQKGAALPRSAYTDAVPELHYQLQAINKQLMNFWKIEEPRP